MLRADGGQRLHPLCPAQPRSAVGAHRRAERGPVCRGVRRPSRRLRIWQVRLLLALEEQRHVPPVPPVRKPVVRRDPQLSQAHAPRPTSCAARRGEAGHRVLAAALCLLRGCVVAVAGHCARPSLFLHCSRVIFLPSHTHNCSGSARLKILAPRADPPAIFTVCPCSVRVGARRGREASGV